MRAISLWQPWASAIAVGSKRFETRSWATKYRGPIAIHAAKRCNRFELIGFKCSWNWSGALAAAVGGTAMGSDIHLDEALPFGALVAVAEITACVSTGELTQRVLDEPRSTVLASVRHPDLYEWTERQMGDFSLGRFAWQLENVRPLREPIPMKGRQGFWTLSAEEVLAVHAQLPNTVVAFEPSGVA